LRLILRTTFRWAIAWALLGVIAGVLMMFGKVPPIAESGGKPSDLSFYSFWIPLLGGATGVFGFALGFVFSCLMALTAKWRASIEARQGVLGRHGPRMLCGAVAGGLVALPLIHDASVFLFAGLGACTAVVSSAMYWRAIHTGQRTSLQDS
jgi:hypothetical protein